MAGKFTPCCAVKPLFSLVLALFVYFSSFSQNPIVTENALPGNPYSEWGVPDFRDNRIAGFATQMSINAGQTVHFKVSSQSGASFTMKIYRIGYYNGNGARLIQNFGTLTGVAQPTGITDAVTGLLDCDNWSESAQWAIPSNAVSGLYIAKIERTGGGSNHIVFIVRNDASNSDLYLQFPDATWQAYNVYGGSSLYDGTTSMPNGHATKVSYNRPFFITNSLFNTDGRGSDWYMNAEYPMIRWLERNGYNVTYTTCEDISANPSHLLTHKVYLSVGHDEYVSKEQRNSVEAARNAGVNLAFFSGNEFYWKTRYENDASGDSRRTLVCYKEGLLADGSFGERTCGNKCDASSPEWTGLWRTGAGYDGNRPENALTGQMSWDEAPGVIQVPSTYKKLRFWRNTSIATLGAGQTASLAPNSLGYEWDYEQFQSSYPESRITMSSTFVNNKTHKLSLYRHPSGALVFGAGTVQWSWGLDDAHYGGSPVVSTDMQQATVNLFADMGVQPATLQSGLTAATKSTDLVGPGTVITSPTAGSSFPSEASVTINGTATDAGGGVVAGVEVSVDGGVTWQQATVSAIDGSVTWTFSFTPTTVGTINVKSRGFDDSGNRETPGAGINITITIPNCPCHVFRATDIPAIPKGNDGQAIVVGMKFRASQNGTIDGIRYYKGAGTTGTHKGMLYTSNGTLLAQATFTGETTSGWQSVSFTTPVNITANTTYIAAYHSASGDYASTGQYFNQAVVNGYLRGLANGEDGPNGMYRYSSTPIAPTESFGAANYFVDVTYSTTPTGPDLTPPTVTGVSPVNNATSVSIITNVVGNFSEAVGASTVTGATFQLKGPGNVVIPASVSTNGSQITLTPSASLNNSTTYTATITGGASGVKDLAGNALASDYNWSFTTVAPDLTPPTVSSVSPPNGAINVSTSPSITADLNEAISASSVTTSSFILKDAGNNSVAATVSTNGAQITLTPTAALSNLSVYSVTIKGGASGVKDLAGNPIANDYIWSFTTAAQGSGTGNTIFQPTDEPGHDKANDGQGIIVGMKFLSTQNGSITGLRYYKGEGTTGTHTGQLWTSGGTLLAQLTFTGETASGWQQALFSTPVNITANTIYMATYHSPSGDYAASNPYFTTAKVNGPLRALASGESGPNGMYKYTATPAFPTSSHQTDNYWVDVVFSAVDLTPPTVTTVTPANNATNVAITSNVTATLSEALNPGSVTTSTVLLNAGTTAIPASVSLSSNVITLTPTSALTNATVYTVTIVGGAPGVKDVAGNALAANYSWSFTTDNTAPTVVTVTPANGATGLAISTNATATFSEALNPASVTTSTISLKAGATDIPVTVGLASNVITLTPTSPLTNATVYTVTIASGPTGVKDLAGNSLASDYSWSFTTDNTPPTVTAATPLNGATGVSLNTTVTAVFSEALDLSTISGTTFLLTNPSNSLVPATFSYNASTRTATLTPSAPLAGSTLYTATVTGGALGVKDAAGNAMASDFAWSFTTLVVDVTPPTVTLTTPSDGATNASTGTAVTATFNEKMTASTINSTNFTLRNPSNTLITSTVSYNATTRVATLTPSAALSGLTTYTATIKGGSTGVKDSTGNALANDTAWSFTTVLIDLTPPTVTSVSPASGATGVATNTTVTATFSELMNASTITSTNVELRNASNTLITTTLSYNATTGVVTLTPSAALTGNAVYTATVKGGTTGVKDAAGNALASNFVWSFTTIDNTPPTVSSVTPANNATNVAVTATVTGVFSEAMDASTITTTNVELRNASNTLITTTLAYNATTRTVTLTPSVALPGGIVYTATIKGGSTGVKDVAGNALVNNYVWSFTTVDNVPPTVTTVTPANGATGVANNTTITAVFSEAMTASTITTSNVELRNPSNTLITRTIAYNATSRTLTLTPSATLANGTVYTVTIKTAVKDAAGNALASNYVWSFTTASSDVTPPTVTSVTPADGSTGMSTSSTVTAVFSEAMTTSTITTTNVELRNASNTLITTTLSYNTSTRTVTLTPSAALANSTVYTATVKGGSTGVKDAAGNALASNYVWSFTTAAPSSTGSTVFTAASTPSIPRANDGQAIEVGIKFRATANGNITALRYYKGSGTTGTHTGHLWTSTGTLLASATFTGESATGWQQAELATPVAITANTTYVVSYFSPSGDYAATNPYFTSAVVNGPLRGLATGEDGPNGCYKYNATSTFPNNSHQSDNYWADVVFQQSGGLITGVLSGATETVTGLLSHSSTTGQEKLSTTQTAEAGKPIVEGREVVIAPNPSTSAFRININSSVDGPVTVRIFDMYGRVVERKEKLSPVATLQVGELWRTGTYYAEIIQGDRKTIIKLLKVR